MRDWATDAAINVVCDQKFADDTDPIADALRKARADALEEAARTVLLWSLPTIQTASMWLIDKEGIAAAIRALKEKQP